jgi:hypothetical protein
MNPEEIARIETLDELSLLFTVVQQLGANLEKQTSGYLHHHARELSELMQQARRRLDLIKIESRKLDEAAEMPDMLPAQHRPRAF